MVVGWNDIFKGLKTHWLIPSLTPVLSIHVHITFSLLHSLAFFCILMSLSTYIEGRRRRGQQDEMAGWHHWLNGHEFEQIREDRKGLTEAWCAAVHGVTELYRLSDWTTTYIFVNSILFHENYSNIFLLNLCLLPLLPICLRWTDFISPHSWLWLQSEPRKKSLIKSQDHNKSILPSRWWLMSDM